MLKRKKLSWFARLWILPKYCSMFVLAIMIASLSIHASAVWASDAKDSAAEEDNPNVWKPQTRSVAVFKNGLGFFMREGEVKLRDGWCVAQHIPPAAFGTLAIYAFDEKESVDIVGSGPGEVVEFDGRDAPKDSSARRARLEACMNLKVQLNYEYKGQKRSTAGKLVSVGSDFAVLDNDGNNSAVPVDSISRMQILELPLRIHVLKEDEKEGKKTATNKLGMAYLRKGITWIPDYTLKVLDDDTAELTLRGTIVNEAEDLIHTDVNLVVGVPHFAHSDFMAPTAVGQIIRAISTTVAPQAVSSQIMNRAALVSNNSMAPQFNTPESATQPGSAEGGNLAAALGNLPQFGGGAASDYTVYTKKDLTLRCGEKAIVTLFTKKIKYSHIYSWSPPEKIAHALFMNNQTDTAWTTGPCLAISSGQALSEDLLQYTPKGGKGELPVASAINIAQEKSEREIDRKLNAHTPAHDFNLDLVTLEGKLRLRNYEKRSVDIVITNPISGKPIAAENGGDISVDSSKLQLLDRAGTITWTMKLEPGEEKTLTYKYEKYVPSK
jgi:hypothetical protein